MGKIDKTFYFVLYFEVKSLDSGAGPDWQQKYEFMMYCDWCEGVEVQAPVPEYSFDLKQEPGLARYVQFDTREVYNLENQGMEIDCPYEISAALRRRDGAMVSDFYTLDRFLANIEMRQDKAFIFQFED